MKKRVFITGITGMVGSHLLDYIFNKTNFEIYGFARWRSPLENINHHIKEINKKNSRIKILYGDLNDKSSVHRAIKFVKPKLVFHLAAQSYPAFSYTAPNVTYEANIIGTTNLCDALYNYSRDSIIHICSSSEVYGKVDKKNIPITENCPFHPASPYSISKIGTDLIGQHYAEAYGMNTQITRMFTHTGPRRGDVFAESSFAKQIAMMEKNYIDPIIKVGNINSMRTILDVRDAVRAYYILLTHNPIPGSVYNIGGNHSCEISKVLEFLISSSKRKDITYEVDQTRLRPIDANNQIPDCTKFINHTKWKPNYNFEETMTDLLNYWRHIVSIKGKDFLQR